MKRLRITQCLALGLVVLGVSLVGSPSASAAWGTLPGYVPGGQSNSSYRTQGSRYQGHGAQSHGNRGYSNWGNHYQCSPRAYQARRSYGRSNYGRSSGYGGSRYHDTSHYDYHAPSLKWHGNHFDYTPGHYDLHRTGHYDHR